MNLCGWLIVILQVQSVYAQPIRQALQLRPSRQQGTLTCSDDVWPSHCAEWCREARWRERSKPEMRSRGRAEVNGSLQSWRMKRRMSKRSRNAKPDEAWIWRVFGTKAQDPDGLSRGSRRAGKERGRERAVSRLSARAPTPRSRDESHRAEREGRDTSIGCLARCVVVRQRRNMRREKVGKMRAQGRMHDFPCHGTRYFATAPETWRTRQHPPSHPLPHRYTTFTFCPPSIRPVGLARSSPTAPVPCCLSDDCRQLDRRITLTAFLVFLPLLPPPHRPPM